MFKKVIAMLIMSTMLCISVLSVSAAGYVTLYSADGRESVFLEEEVPAQLEVGWYRVYPVLMWASDGRTMYVSGDEVETYMNLNWYINEETDICVVDSGKTIYVPQGMGEKIAYNKLYYSQIPAKMYSGYGDEMYVPQGMAGTYKNLNWFYTYPVYMWTEDGRVIAVEQYEVDAYKNVGWYSYDEDYPVDLYSLDGICILVREADVPQYTKMGWYEWTDYRYNSFKNEANACMNNGDYEGVYDTFDTYRWSLEDTEYQDELYSYKYRAREAWRKAANGAPLVFTGYQNIDGNKVEFDVRNISYKTVIAVKLNFVCYDIFGTPLKYCYEYTWGNGGDLMLGTDEMSRFYIDYVSGISGAYRAGNFEITEVVFSDNSKWTNY